MWKNDKKAKFFFRDRPARWRARRAHCIFPDALAEGFFLLILGADSDLQICRAPTEGRRPQVLRKCFNNQK